jgi:hypothetical protein
MGVGRHLVEALIRERNYRPLAGEVLLVGRQTVYLAPETLLELLKEHGIDVADIRPEDLEIDKSTVDRHRSFSADEPLVSDTQLLRLLGAERVLALDHSDYEGAEIVHDLTKTVPDKLRGCADFIIDGSTLDNVFDPAIVITNFAEMLRPRGRLITTNMYSNHYEPYVIVPPLWYLDYFTVNGFIDCKVYILVYNEDGSRTDVFTIDVDALIDPTRVVSAFTAPGMMATIVVAEKGSNSTTHLRPSQQQYRSAEEWDRYRDNLKKIRSSDRPHLVRSTQPISFEDVRSGHLFMADDFTARDPWTEILRLRQQTETVPLEAAAPALPSQPFWRRFLRHTNSEPKAP